MKTQTHTPGPWAVDPVLRGGPWYRIESEHGPAIGWVAQVQHPNSANAALIAAAPDLLATAKRLADWGSMETPNTPENLASIITDAVRAIAKAEGGAE